MINEMMLPYLFGVFLKNKNKNKNSDYERVLCNLLIYFLILYYDIFAYACVVIMHL